MTDAPRSVRKAVTRRTAAAALTLAVLAATAACSDGSTSPAPTRSGRQDAVACGERVTVTTLARLFPGFDRTTGSLAAAPPDVGGLCSVLAVDGSTLADVDAQYVPDAARLATNLQDALTATGARPGPSSLGRSAVVEQAGVAGASVVAGAYWVVVTVKGAPATGSRLDAAVALATDVTSWYATHGATPSATP